MKKTSKLLVLLLLVVALIFSFSVKVQAAQILDLSGYADLDSAEGTTKTDNAEDDKDEYEELEDESESAEDDKKDTEKETEDSKETDDSKEVNKANKADKDHVQAGSFDTVIYVSVATIAIFAIILAYTKIKKYNY